MHAGQRRYVTSAPAANGGPYRRCAVWNRISIQVWLSISRELPKELRRITKLQPQRL